MIPSRGPYARANRPSLVKQEAQLPQRDSASTLCLWKSCRLLLIATDTIFEEVCNRRMTFKVIGIGAVTAIVSLLLCVGM